jgi:hypothetical protein
MSVTQPHSYREAVPNVKFISEEIKYIVVIQGCGKTKTPR